MVKATVWCYATGREVEVEGTVTPNGWLKPQNCPHKDCPKRYAVDCLIGKIPVYSPRKSSKPPQLGEQP